MGLLPGENCELCPQIPIGETTRQQTKPDQQAPESQYPEVGDAQSRSSLPAYLHWAIQLQHRFFSHGAVLAEAFDFENTSVGLKADLPQSGQVTQSLADGKVACVVDGRFGAGTHFAHLGNLFEVLFDARVLIVDMLATSAGAQVYLSPDKAGHSSAPVVRDHAIGQHTGPESSRRSLRDSPVEDQLHPVGPAEVEILADDLLEQHPPAQRTVQDLRQRKPGL